MTSLALVGPSDAVPAFSFAETQYCDAGRSGAVPAALAGTPGETADGSRRDTSRHTPTTICNTHHASYGALLLMMLMVLVSLWTTFDINLSLPKISGMELGLGIFFAVVRAGLTPRSWWLGLLFFMVIGFGIVGIRLLGTHWVTKIAILTPIISRLSPRITGLPGAEVGFNQNEVAGALLWIIPRFLASSWLLLTK